MDLASLLTQIDDILYTWLLIYLLAGSGIYFSIRTRFVQIRRFKDAMNCMLEKKDGDKWSISLNWWGRSAAWR